jgi:hypothetical protein
MVIGTISCVGTRVFSDMIAEGSEKINIARFLFFIFFIEIPDSSG